MTDEKKTNLAENTPENTSENKINVYENFSYVGTKESIAYLLNDVSNTFNIGAYSERYIWDVVKIDFTVSAVVNLFTSAWDIINDLFLSTLVDNTRTRLGKFRPYLLTLQIPLTLLGSLYWMLPVFSRTHPPLSSRNSYFISHSTSFRSCRNGDGLAKGGYMSTITPNPNERVRLITWRNFIRLFGRICRDIYSVHFTTLSTTANLICSCQHCL